MKGDYPLTVGVKRWYPNPYHYTCKGCKDSIMRMIPNIRSTVGFVCAHDGEKYLPLGTGFFTYVREDTRTFLYLITCKHVVDKEIDIQPLYVRLNRSDKPDVEYVPLEQEWAFHNDQSVDLAVTEFKLSEKLCEFEPVNIETVFVPDEYFDRYLTEGDRIAFVGLFRKIPGTHKNTPVYRYGHIAMIPDARLGGKYGDADYLVVECVAFKGNSGSPLWVAIHQPTDDKPNQYVVYILGVMTQVYIEEEIEKNQSGKQTICNSGISLAVPIKYAREILLGDKLVAERKRRVKEERHESDKPIPISADFSSPEGDPFTRDEFMSALRKVSRPVEDQPDSEKPETSE